MGDRMLVLALVWALAPLGSAVPASAQEVGAGVTVTLEEAIARAYEHNPQLAQALGATRTAAAAERSTMGSFLPTLSFGAGSSLASTERFDPNNNTTVTGSSDSYSAGLSASVDLFTAGRRGAERRQAQAQSTAADAQLLASRYDVALTVERAFYEELRAEELAVVAETRIERAERGLEAAERRYQVGSATRSDVLRATLELNTAREAVLRARTQRADAAFALGRLIGIDGPANARADAEPVTPRPLALTDAEILELLANESPAVEAAEASVRAAGASVSATRTQYLPTLRASSGYDWYNQDPALVDGRTSWSMRLSLSYPIFDGFRRSESMERVRVQEHVAGLQLADARRAVRADAERALGQLRLAAERIALSEEAVVVAEEDLRVQQERYAQGMSTILDLLASQTGLVEAQNGLVSARFDYRLARAELEALAGRAL